MKVSSCNPGRAYAAVSSMMANGRYATPPPLVRDCTFLYEPHDASYLELASAMLFGRPGGEDGGALPDGDPTQLVADFPPRVSHYVRCCDPCGSQCTPFVPGPMTQEEWLMYWDRDSACNSLSWNKYRLIDLKPFMGEFGRSPVNQFLLNLFLPLPSIHRYLAVCSGSPSTRAYKTDSCLVRFERLAAAAWVLYLGVSYMHKICNSGTAMVLEGGTIALMERFQGAFPLIPVSPDFTGVWHKSTVVWDDILRFAGFARDSSRDSRFARKYSGTRVEDLVEGTLGQKPA